MGEEPHSSVSECLKTVGELVFSAMVLPCLEGVAADLSAGDKRQGAWKIQKMATPSFGMFLGWQAGQTKEVVEIPGCAKIVALPVGRNPTVPDFV